MRRFTNILFSPLGQHDNSLAVRRISKLVIDTDVRLTLFGVIPTSGGLRRLLSRSDVHESLEQSQCEELEHDLRTWGRRIGCSDVDVVIHRGSAAVEIINRVVSEGHDLVVVTTDDDQEDHATIRRLLRKCPCPVWEIHPTRARTLRVLAAVNPDPDELELNRLILELAASMNELHGGDLHVVHAWQLYGEATLRSPGFVHASRDEVDRLVENARSDHEQAIAELLAHDKVANAPWQVHLIKGPAADVVAAVAEKQKINLLVTGTVARTGLRGLVMGNTAENILDRVSCSVIAVKPPGFVSPLDPRAA